MRSIAWLLVLCLVAPATAQLPAPDAPDVTGDLDAEADNATSQAQTQVQDGTAQAGSTTQATIANHTLTAAANATVILHPVTNWTFDLPLYDDTFAFRSANGSHHDNVTITVAWQQGGEAADWPGEASLQLEGSSTHTLAGTQNGSIAVFVVPQQLLIPDAHNSWRLSVHADGGLGWSSAYHNGTDAAIEGPVQLQGRMLQAHDTDEDSHPDDVDNCPQQANADQANMDGDLHGDVCDDDIDGDGYNNTAESDAGSDPRDPHKTPDDLDGDGHNNTAEAEARSDPRDPRSTPHDPDADGHDNDVEASAGSDPYDAASTPHDPDADGLDNHEDNCDRHANVDQADGDADGIGDACDTRPEDGPAGDEDGDGVQNSIDNCRMHSNADQANMDGDRLGDICDADIDGDGHVNWAEPFRFDANEWADNDLDGIGDNADQDDDNDGLSDDAEAAIGTDPFSADTDADRYSDLDEIRLGSDPTDHHDPPYLPEARAIANSDGTVTIEWDGTGDARISRYIVWERGSTRLVGEADANGGSHALVDADHDGGDLMYAVQPVFHDEMFERNSTRSATAYMFVRDAVAWQSDADAGGPATAQEPTPTVTPIGEDAPGIAWLGGLAVAGVALYKRRQV